MAGYTSGKLRSDIMSKCPEDFKDELKGFIDNIENTINKARERMLIKSLSDLYEIENAYQELVALVNDLY